jgi:hypothetical protein
MTEITITGFSPVGGASIRLVPSKSDQFHRLAQGLAEISRQHPNDIAPPAGVVVIAAAALEAYVNELIEIGIPSARQGEIRGLGTNLIGKLRWLRDNSDHSNTRAEFAAGVPGATWFIGAADPIAVTKCRVGACRLGTCRAAAAAPALGSARRGALLNLPGDRRRITG